MEVFLVLIKIAIIFSSSWNLGNVLSSFGIPKVTVYLLVGALVGPQITQMLTNDDMLDLTFVNAIALPCIGFAAGNEMHISHITSPATWYLLIGILGSVFSLVFLTFSVVARSLPMLQNISWNDQFALGIIISTVLCARSPASAIAVAKDLRAEGPFTSASISVSVLLDSVMILIFSMNLELSKSLFHGVPITYWTVGIALLRILLSICFGYVAGNAFCYWNRQNVSKFRPLPTEQAVLLACGICTFLWVPGIEPLLSCMVIGFVFNSSTSPKHYHELVASILPYSNVAFFTLSGSSLHLDVLLRSLSVVLLMFFARLAGLMIGASFGSTFAGWRPRLRKYAWMGFVTQAGFSMGLAREAALEFPEHSETLLTFIVGVIVMNEVVGPPLFNYAIVQLGEDQGGSWEKEREEREREERKHDP